MLAFSLVSFQAWDKYLLGVLPAALIALLARPAASEARLSSAGA